MEAHLLSLNRKYEGNSYILEKSQWSLFLIIAQLVQSSLARSE